MTRRQGATQEDNVEIQGLLYALLRAHLQLRGETSVQSAQTSDPTGGKSRWRVPSTSSGPAHSRPVRTVAAIAPCPDFSKGTSAPGEGVLSNDIVTSRLSR